MVVNYIVVVGAGVSGLTTALLLSKSKDNKITIIAKHMPGDYDIEYASPYAGANIMPMLPAGSSRWERRSWPEFKRLTEAVPEAGIHFQSKNPFLSCCVLKTHTRPQYVEIYRRDQDLNQGSAMDPPFDKDPWYKPVVDNYDELPSDQIIPGHNSGAEFNSMCINVIIYLNWLIGQCLKNGVVIKRGNLKDINEATSLTDSAKPATFVINCTGLGSHNLGSVMDTNLVPSRGQTVLVRNESTPMICSSGTNDGDKEILYLMQRAAGGGTIIGGTYDIGNWDPTPDPEIGDRIMKRIVEARPEIADGKGIGGLDVIRHQVGLRPYRKGGVRIDIGELDDGTPVVHNYGHAGWGYQGSYGCAERVVELVNGYRKEKLGQSLAAEPQLFS